MIDKEGNNCTVRKILAELHTKVISPRGENYYLVLRVLLEDAEGKSFKTFYSHSNSEKRIGEMVFYTGDLNTELKIDEVLRELLQNGFVQPNPKSDIKFRVDRPVLPKGE